MAAPSLPGAQAPHPGSARAPRVVFGAPAEDAFTRTRSVTLPPLFCGYAASLKCSRRGAENPTRGRVRSPDKNIPAQETKQPGLLRDPAACEC
jgi:hypothetical protein